MVRTQLERHLPKRHLNKSATIPLPTGLAEWDWERGPLLYGPRGTGKTQACVNLVVQRVMTGAVPSSRVAWLSTSRYFEDRRRMMNGEEVDLPNWQDAHLVVLDDFAKERPSTWVQEQTFVMLDDLYNREVDLAITCNVESPADIERHVGEFSYDRIREMMRSFSMAGQSWRGK